MSLLEESERLRIPFGDIKEATKNFTTLIGKGGYGLVYKGELIVSGKLTTVAVKRLQVSFSGQGFKEFLTEIQLLTRYKHPNLISLIGFCNEGEEKILIYDYAEHGSLDNYLSSAENRRTLTWKRRLNICVNAARGLYYLHNEAAVNERVIHRDIKSANVLLDQDWKAMISDLGLSKLGRANEKDTYLITNASGTYVYCDPVYTKSGILTKESDVYSFGVVLFEVLCGRLCVIDVHNEHRFLPQLAQSYYKKGQINEIMDPELQNQLDSYSLKKFSEIAFKCIHNTRKQRPSMRWVLKKLEELEKTLDLQIDSHVKRLDEDLHNFAEDLKQEGKLPADEPAILPPLPLVPKLEKRTHSKKLEYRDREWDHRDRDFELMPPPGDFKRDYVPPLEIEQPIDPNEPTYCVCHQVSFGEMIACDNENCQGGEWFHFSCVGLTPETMFKGKWYCPTCRQLPLW